MSMLLSDVASLVEGELHGDGAITISGAAILRDARVGDITLVDSEKVAKQLEQSCAAAVIVPSDIRPAGIAYVSVGDVHSSFARIVSRLRPSRPLSHAGVAAAAHVDPSATIGRNVIVYPDAWIDADVCIGERAVIHAGVRILAGSKIGSDTSIFPNTVLYEDTVVGNRVCIHAGAVIGAYGFGYDTVQGKHERSAQLGNVIIGDDVEIGACTTIDRGTYGPTFIGEGTKIDNQVMIAHNCRIGRHNLICSQVGVAGSCTTGDYVVMAGQVGLRDHVEIGNRVVLGAKSGVVSNIADDSRFVGIPATPDREQLVKQAALAKLPEMRKEFKALQKRIEEIERRLVTKAA